MRKASIALCVLAALIAFLGWVSHADAYSGYYTTYCSTCHAVSSTCAGCHAHGVHSSSAKDDLNITGVTNKTTYAPGETVSVTINGGNRSGWVRAILYDQSMVELARSSGPGGMGGGASFPVTLSALAPTTPGTYTWNVSWYGNVYDSATAFFGPRWTPDPVTPNHGQEIVGTNAFTVTTPPAPIISLTPASLDFGTVTVGGSAAKTTVIQNQGSADLIVSAIALCPGTSAEYTWSPTAVPFTIPAGGSMTLSVTYTPGNAGTDTGCLNISSNDPVTPTAVLAVTGTGTVPTQPIINLTPASLDLGTVTVGSSAAKTTLIQNLGNADLIVDTVALCPGTSTEYTWSPTAVPFTIPAGGSMTLSVTYAPVDAGTDTGCLNVSSNDPATPTAVLNLTGTGSLVPPPGADFTIQHFWATHRVSISKEKTVELKLRVKNAGTVEGTAPATVIGVQNGVQVYNQAITVSDPVGRGGTLFVLPPYTPTTAGDILWTATIIDPTPDTATATTVVVP